MKNIVLIGMPGAGKSTIGVVLAKMLGYHFIDSDLLIQAQEDDILEHLIERYGIDGFLAIENQVNCDIDARKTVISTGGSACYCEEAMLTMSQHAVMVYLNVGYETLYHRLGDLHERGVVIRKGSTLRDLYNERAPLYERYADLIIDVDGCPLEESLRRVKEKVKSCEKLYED